MKRASSSPVYLVTVLFNSEKVLPVFIESLKKQKDLSWRLIAIDNASGDRGAEILASLNDERVLVIVNAENRGVAAANNQGISIAISENAEWVFIVNNDTSFEEGCLTGLLTEAAAWGAKLATPFISYASNENQIYYAGGVLKRWPNCRGLHIDDGGILQDRHKIQGWQTYAPTCFLLVHADVFKNVGLMWEPYFVYSDDVDFMFRVQKSGYRVLYCPFLIVAHHVGFSTGGNESNFSKFYGARNRMLLIRRNAPKWAVWGQCKIYHFFLWAKFIIRRESLESYKIRKDGLLEGLLAAEK